MTHYPARMRKLIVTADDFGLAEAVNAAVERAHVDGILSSASLMVNGAASADAIDRARRLPRLGVGLHVVLVNGRATLSPDRIPLLVDRNGNFTSDLLRAGVRYFFIPGIRAQLEAEVRAQFEAFAATGLRLDHVNAQNHLHVHPTILSLILKVGREFGARAVRIPREPFWPSYLAMRTRLTPRLVSAASLFPLLALMRFRAESAGMTCNDALFGMHESGHMTASAVRAFITNLPCGISEVYSHPATHAWTGAFPPDYDFAGEAAALTDPEVIAAMDRSGAERTTYSDLCAAHGG